MCDLIAHFLCKTCLCEGLSFGQGYSLVVGDQLSEIVVDWVDDGTSIIVGCRCILVSGVLLTMVVFAVVVVFLCVGGCWLGVCVVSKRVGGSATLAVALVVGGVGLLPYRVENWMVRVASLAVGATARACFIVSWMIGVASMAVGATARACSVVSWMIGVASMAV